jgi:ABC-2 type transport system ATP-binding protein
MSETLLAAQDLCKSFDSRTVLQNITVSVPRGDIVGVLGKNGAGKTTLLEVLLGLSPASSGQAEAFGTPSLELPAAVKARVGFVPQQDELIHMLTGEQQLRVISAFHKHWDSEFVSRLTRDWQIPLKSRIGTMSVGERQKLSVVLAFAHRPELIVLDEPVASLDPIARRDFLRQLLDVAEMDSRAVVFSSHIVSDLERAANQVWILREGRLAWSGEIDTLKESVVRLHLTTDEPMSALPQWAGLLGGRLDGRRATIAIRDWQPGVEATLAQRYQANVEVERLSLEEIFVEING